MASADSPAPQRCGSNQGPNLGGGLTTDMAGVHAALTGVCDMPNHYTLVAICGGYCDGFDDDGATFEDHRSNLGEVKNFCDLVRPMPEGVKGEVPGLDPPWLVWAREHWGTKWGTYSMRVAEGGDCGATVLVMQCAWGHPNKSCMDAITDYLKDKCGFTAVKWVGFDPYDASIADVC